MSNAVIPSSSVVEESVDCVLHPATACILGLMLGMGIHFYRQASDNEEVERMILSGCSLTKMERVSGAWKRTWACPGGLIYVM